MTHGSESKIRLAIVGCGAISSAYLLATQDSQDIEITALVDKDESRAIQLAEKYHITFTADDYKKIVGRCDAAVIALPHYLHAGVTVDLLRAGMHVLVEKPMAMNTSECDEMIRAASESDRLLAVGQLRRFFYSSQFIKRIIETRVLGQIKSFEFREGVVFNWPVVSSFTFRKEFGGGVLADTGAHVLDLLLWWLGDYESIQYYDDAMGGVEADCELHVQLKCGAAGVVELSRTRDLRNTLKICGERGTLEVQSQFNSQIRLQLEGQDIALGGIAKPDGRPEEDAIELFRRQFDNFFGAIRGQQSLFVPGYEGRPAVELIEACHSMRQPLIKPWTIQPKHVEIQRRTDNAKV